jgi:formylglycine-generating enzyme required for sulfatase activity
MMATDKPQSLRVFLCHSSGDKPAVRELCRRLCAEGIDAWLDEEKLLPGQDWQLEIPKAVCTSDVVIVCLSRGSVTKAGYVQKEIKFALDVADEQPEGTIFLIPALLEECEVPERLSRWQWVNLHEAKGYKRLMHALRVRAGELGVGLSPEQPRSTPPRPAPGGLPSDRAELRQKLVEHFNREELRTLCFDLGIEHENLPDTKDSMARELVAHCERQGRIPELVAACQRLHPKVPWGTDMGMPAHARLPKTEHTEPRDVLAPAPQPVKQAPRPVVPQKSAPTFAAGAMKKLGGIEFVLVPKGKFIMGSKNDNKLAYPNERPQHTVEIPYDYWIAHYPVTNEQFAAFVEATQHKFEWGINWKSKSNHPVVRVSWNDAIAFCQWLNGALWFQITGQVVRPPTEAEWEKAARGEQGNEWPWGNEFDPAKCNSKEGGIGDTTSVGTHSPQGDSPYGAADMVGNVFEWCHSLFKPYPYKANDGREAKSWATDDFHVARGGVWYLSGRAARCAHRQLAPLYLPSDTYYGYGFRVVIAPEL